LDIQLRELMKLRKGKRRSAAAEISTAAKGPEMEETKNEELTALKDGGVLRNTYAMLEIEMTVNPGVCLTS